jgi:hypothetical protein
MRQNLGPTLKTFEALAPADQEAFSRDMIATMKPYNQSNDETLFVVTDYTEAVISLK